MSEVWPIKIKERVSREYHPGFGFLLAEDVLNWGMLLIEDLATGQLYPVLLSAACYFHAAIK